MDPAPASYTPSSSAAVFQDALGERHRLDGTGADPIELLHLRGELTEIPSFEFALRERASRLATFRHTYYGRVRSVDRLDSAQATLAVVSDHTRGVRLSTLLSETGPRPITIDINVALHFIRQIVSAVAFLHESARDVAHGAIGPERIIVTPNARAVIVEYVLGAALEQLRFSHDRYWRDLRIPLPASAGLPRFDHRADVTQVGAVALALILGRMLHDDESGDRLADVVGSTWAISAKGGLEPLPPGLRVWLSRALQLDPRHSFASVLDARFELDKVLAGEQKDERPAAPPRPAERAAVEHPEVPRPVARVEHAEAPRPAARVEHTEVPRPAARVEHAEVPRPAARVEEPRPEPVAVTHQEPVATKPQPPVVKPVESAVPPPPPVFEPTWQDAIADDDTARDAFMSHAATPPRRVQLVAAVVVGVVVVAGAGVMGARRFFSSPAPSVAATGTLSISSSPSGAVVLVDGDSRGVTPLSIPLKPGLHNVELRGGGDPRSVPVTITAGTQVTQYIELPALPSVQMGQIQIRTEPAGAQVSVDGVPRGKSPLLIEGVAPGEHLVLLESSFGTVKQTVTVTGATTASLVVPLGASEGAPLSGWVSVSAPVDVQIFENKQLLGTSQSDRLMVSAGRHEIEIVNQALGYRATKTVQVPAGKVAAVKVEWPNGTIAVNAVPWAEVWIDGERVGDTPIGNHSLPIGPHEIVFRHPELGELRHATTVTANAPARVSVDMRKKP